MAQFAITKAAQVKQPVTADTTVEYELEGLTRDPIILMVTPATEENAPYFNASLRAAGQSTGRGRKNVNVKMVKNVRNSDRKLYAQYVVTGWKNVQDTDGNDVVFTATSCQEFLSVLPNDYFDDLRDFCSDLRNFTADVIDEGVIVEN